MRKFLTSFALVGALALTSAIGVAFASHVGWHLFGDAEIVAGGNPGNAAQIRSDSAPGYGGIDFDVAAGMTFAELETLATDYKFELDDSCGAGSPRFQVNVDSGAGDTGNIFVYIGPPPNYTLCPPSVWLNTGDLLEGVNLIDTAQLDGGGPYDPYTTALAKYGEYAVTGVQLVVDSGWWPPFLDGEQTVLVDNTNVDGTIYTYDEQGHPQSKDDCKDGGWMDLANDEGEAFKNQGDCVSYFNTT